MNKLLIITGPTSIGKTQISIELCKILNGEVISADSMQIYKHMDIGSAKISKDEMQGVPHHLINIKEPHESFSASDFKLLAEDAIKDIASRGKLPVIAGGTGLYINSLIYNYSFTEANKDEDYRNYLMSIAEKEGKEYLHSMLKDVDRESYERLYPNDVKRIVRALEVHKLTGIPFSQFNASEASYNENYDFEYFVLNMDREKLYDRINKRVDLMLANGLMDEVIKLKNMGYNADMQSMKGIGYKEILNYLEGCYSYDEAVELIKKGTRNYAKRQLTWFRKEPRAIWIDKGSFEDDNEIVKVILSQMENKTF